MAESRENSPTQSSSNDNSPMNEEDDSLFCDFPDGTRIIIQDGKVIFENLTPELLEIARALNPDDPNLKDRD